MYFEYNVHSESIRGLPMSHGAEVQAADLVRAVSGLPEFSSTRLATGIGAITREVIKRGAAVITKHDAPVMVLVSIERYAEMERAAAPDLDALTSRFDALYARMQAQGVAERTIAALELGVGSAKSRKAPARRRS